MATFELRGPFCNFETQYVIVKKLNELEKNKLFVYLSSSLWVKSLKSVSIFSQPLTIRGIGFAGGLEKTIVLMKIRINLFPTTKQLVELG
jgi:hypothetical protein